MTINATLLPNGSSPLEKRAATILRQAVENPNIIADLINPERCPEPLLPYLAWALSVDKWDEKWSESVKRQAIKQSFFIHRHKGTVAAIRRVIEPIGYLVELKEWWQEKPNAPAGTFRLTVEVPETGLQPETYNELVRLVNDVRPISRHLTNLAISVSPAGDMVTFWGQNSGEILSIYPNS